MMERGIAYGHVQNMDESVCLASPNLRSLLFVVFRRRRIILFGLRRNFKLPGIVSLDMMCIHHE
jgi:hypothetical protein